MRTEKEFKVSSYLRLAELCSPFESDKKRYYMEMVQQLLEEDDEDEVITFKPMVSDSISEFIKDCEETEVQIVNEPVSTVYTKYQGYCIRNGFTALANNEFSKQIQRLSNLTSVRKRLPGDKNKTSIFVERRCKS